MSASYLPILIFLCISFGLSIALVAVSFLRNNQKPDAQKLAPYECGFDSFDPPKTNARTPFDARFYLVAILFIIFDLEIAYLFPWALTFSGMSAFCFCSMMLFLTVLFVGFIYEWSEGALDWHPSSS